MRYSTYFIPDAGDHVRIVAVHPQEEPERARFIGKSALVIRDHNTLPRGYDPENGFGALVLAIKDGNTDHTVYFHGVKVELGATAQEMDDMERLFALSDPD